VNIPNIDDPATRERFRDMDKEVRAMVLSVVQSYARKYGTLRSPESLAHLLCGLWEQLLRPEEPAERQRWKRAMYEAAGRPLWWRDS
jgi:hypothetical protein